MQLQPATATYRFEVRLLSFSNPSGKSESTRVDCDSPLDECDTYFSFCLRDYNAPPSLKKSICKTTPLLSRVFEESNDINFMSLTDIGPALQNPLVFTGGTWPVVSTMQTHNRYIYAL